MLVCNTQLAYMSTCYLYRNFFHIFPYSSPFNQKTAGENTNCSSLSSSYQRKKSPRKQSGPTSAKDSMDDGFQVSTAAEGNCKTATSLGKKKKQKYLSPNLVNFGYPEILSRPLRNPGVLGKPCPHFSLHINNKTEVTYDNFFSPKNIFVSATYHPVVEYYSKNIPRFSENELPPFIIVVMHTEVTNANTGQYNCSTDCVISMAFKQKALSLYSDMEHGI